MSTTEPSKWSTALGASADVNTLPQTTPTGTGLASLSGLFPQITQIPLDSGGIAPERADFNALFKLLGDTTFFLMQGGTFSYSTDYDYTAGNLVMRGGSLSLCSAANGPGSAVKYPTDTAYWRRLALMSDMPTVNNGTITVQASGATIGSFTVNQGGNSTINIPEATVSSFGVVKTDQHGFDGGLLQGWIRYRSGVQIVYGAGAANTLITFPRAFNVEPVVSATCTTDYSMGVTFACMYTRSTTGVTFGVWDPTASIWHPDGTFTFIAIGTWS